MTDLNNAVLGVLFAAILFYVLYEVTRAGVRDGILQADERRQCKHEETQAGQSGKGPMQ